ncbi:MAG: hypothetical protein K0B02_03230 [DPANN group archaeon]|nr:hypothetical protein [DPANN group archaeon]
MRFNYKAETVDDRVSKINIFINQYSTILEINTAIRDKALELIDYLKKDYDYKEFLTNTKKSSESYAAGALHAAEILLKENTDYDNSLRHLLEQKYRICKTSTKIRSNSILLFYSSKRINKIKKLANIYSEIISENNTIGEKIDETINWLKIYKLPYLVKNNFNEETVASAIVSAVLKYNNIPFDIELLDIPETNFDYNIFLEIITIL